MAKSSVKIAYLLLCHQNVDLVIAQACALADAGDCVMIHWDRRAGHAGRAKLQSAFAGRVDIRLTPRNIACGWGDFSLVRATLLLMRFAMKAWSDVTHLYLISGDCYPLRSAQAVHEFLADDPRDHIESGEYTHLGHISAPQNAQRLRHYYPLNERRSPRGFAALQALQTRLGIARAAPRDLPLRMGRQWWCLRRGTAHAILTLLRKRRDILRFFRWVWVPDEVLFQSVIQMVVPQNQISGQCPTAGGFTRAGTPVVFHNDHSEEIGDPSALFLRKISPNAAELRKRMLEVYQGNKPPTDGDILAQYHAQNPRHIDAAHPFHTVNLKNAPYVLDRGSQLSPMAQVMVAILPNSASKAHAGKLAQGLAPFIDGPALGLISELSQADLPDLGGYGPNISRNIGASLHMMLRASQQNAILVAIRANDSDAIAQLSLLRPRPRICVFTDMAEGMAVPDQNRLCALLAQVGFDAAPLLHSARGSEKKVADLQHFLRLTSDQAGAAVQMIEAQTQKG